MKYSLRSDAANSKARPADKFAGTLEAEALNEIQQSWTKEAIRRRDEIRSGQVKAIPGQEVLDEVRSLVGR